jgi:hypothetical protein
MNAHLFTFNSEDWRIWRALLARALLFAAIFYALMALINWQIGRNVFSWYGLDYRALVERKSASSAILLGTSHFAHGVRPSLLDQESFEFYNYALDAASPSFYAQWYSRLYRKFQPAPRLVLIDVPGFLFDRHKLSRRYEQDSEFFPSAHFWAEMWMGEVERGVLLKHRWPVVKYRRRYTPLCFREHLYMGRPELYERGWMPLIGQAPGGGAIAYEPAQVMDSEVRAFEALLDRLAADGAQVILVQMPVYLPSVTIEPESVARVRELAERRGLPVLDYNAERRAALNDRLEYFYDYGHLNQEGAEIFSRTLAADLCAWLAAGARAEHSR